MIGTKKALILIVDDNPINIQVISSILHEKGYNISISTSGIQALNTISAKMPDLILLDIEMPEMDGYEVCKRLKSDIKTKEIPVIFLTAKIETENIVYGFEIGAVDYITKPFNVAELLARVATHIELKKSREKLIELNATKDKFFSIIAHDVRNPFAGILTGSELLLMGLPLYEKPQIEKSVTRIYDSAKQGFDLLVNLLEWSQTQNEGIKFNPTKLNLKMVAQTSLNLVQELAENKNVLINNQLDSNLSIYADENLLNAVFRNLLTNAIKFTPNAGKITLFARESNAMIEVSISDSGIGMSKNVLENLFKIENKVSTPGTAKETGTGLGLILCKEFIEKHGGKIWVESELDNGSVFKFTVPSYDGHQNEYNK